MALDGDLARERLSRARLMLLYTPVLCPEGTEPLAVLARALPHVDVVQVRIKDPELGVTPARALADEARRVLALVADAELETLVLVNDRVDVAAALAPEGLAGVHLGNRDAPPELARAVLGPHALIGLSTHAPVEVVRAEDAPVDYLGFGPVNPTRTKGYERGLGAEAAWVAARGSARPVFPIGGIDVQNACELDEVGRAAVSRAILAAEDPADAAREIRAALAP